MLLDGCGPTLYNFYYYVTNSLLGAEYSTRFVISKLSPKIAMLALFYNKGARHRITHVLKGLRHRRWYSRNPEKWTKIREYIILWDQVNSLRQSADDYYWVWDLDLV